MPTVNVNVRVVDEADTPLKGFSVSIFAWNGTLLTDAEFVPIEVTPDPTCIPCTFHNGNAKLTLFGPVNQTHDAIRNFVHRITITPNQDLEYTITLQSCPEIDAYTFNNAALAAGPQKGLEEGDVQDQPDDRGALVDLGCKSVNFRLMNLDDRTARYRARMYFHGTSAENMTPVKTITADYAAHVFHVRQSTEACYLELQPLDPTAQTVQFYFKDLEASQDVWVKISGRVVTLKHRSN